MKIVVAAAEQSTESWDLAAMTTSDQTIGRHTAPPAPANCHPMPMPCSPTVDQVLICLVSIAG
jgi:hypothetical protein